MAGQMHSEPLCGLMAREGVQHGELHEAVGDVEVEGAVITGGQVVPRHRAWE